MKQLRRVIVLGKMKLYLKLVADRSFGKALFIFLLQIVLGSFVTVEPSLDAEREKNNPPIIQLK